MPRKYADLRDNCVQRATAADAAVDAARGTIGDWEAHLKDMKALDKGRMTAVHAQKEWVDKWKAAPINMDKFARTGEELGKAPACDP